MRIQLCRSIYRFILKVLVLSVLIGTSVLDLASASKGELPLAPALTQELNLILRAGDGLHKSLVSHDEEQIEMGLRDMIWQIGKAKTALVYAKLHERGHLVRILEAAHDDFEVTQRAFGEERKSRLTAGYNQLVNLARIYKLDRAYSIFFCPKDRTTWIQKGATGSNPFRSDGPRDHCGIRVTK